MGLRNSAAAGIEISASVSTAPLDYLQDRAHLNSALIVSEEIDLNGFWRAYLGENQILLERVLAELRPVGASTPSQGVG